MLKIEERWMIMKRRQHILSVLLIVALIAALAAGCTTTPATTTTASTTAPAGTAGTTGTTGPVLEGNTYVTGLPVVKTKETFKIATVKHTLDKTANWNEKEIFKIAEEQTNIHINWIEIVAGTEAEKIPILLATDLPDAFLRSLTEAHVTKYASQLVVVNKLMDKYAPNIVKQYAEIKNMTDMLKFPDGNIYTLAISRQISPDDDGDAIYFMNQKWLDKVGKKLPTTTDELYTVLKAFKAADCNGNGQADEIPLETCENNWAAKIMKYAGAWGFTDNYKIENNKFIPTVNTKAYRDYIEYFNKLAKEGLLDVEGFSQTNQQFYAKLKSNACGSYSGWTPQSNFDTETAKNYVQVLPMSAPGYEGKTAKAGEYQKFFGTRTGFAITVACKNPNAVLRWWDFLSSTTELKYTFAYGKEGKIWQRDASGQVWTIFPETAADYTRENMKYTEGAYGSNPIILASEQEKNDGTKYPDAVRREAYNKAVKPFFVKEYLPIRFVAPEKVNDRAMIETDLNSYIANFLATSIVNGVTDATWAAHLKQLDALNLKGWVDWYQNFLDKKY
jgi:putative aldouronate transport system substrate-binding protein